MNGEPGTRRYPSHIPTSQSVQCHDILSKVSRDIRYTFAPTLSGHGVFWDGVEGDGC